MPAAAASALKPMATRMPLMATTAEQKLCNNAKTKLDQVSNLVRALLSGALGTAEATSASCRSRVGLVFASFIKNKLADFQLSR